MRTTTRFGNIVLVLVLALALQSAQVRVQS